MNKINSQNVSFENNIGNYKHSVSLLRRTDRSSLIAHSKNLKTHQIHVRPNSVPTIINAHRKQILKPQNKMWEYARPVAALPLCLASGSLRLQQKDFISSIMSPQLRSLQRRHCHITGCRNNTFFKENIGKSCRPFFIFCWIFYFLTPLCLDVAPSPLQWLLRLMGIVVLPAACQPKWQIKHNFS